MDASEISERMYRIPFYMQQPMDAFFAKHDGMAEKAREAGNKLFEKSLFYDALIKYNEW